MTIYLLWEDDGLFFGAFKSRESAEKWANLNIPMAYWYIKEEELKDETVPFNPSIRRY